ncbi:hypothetical protein KCP75_26205 [Salmonella enterica subsp. enterica]|nr:hypothetical protein KCP75_26205 [Salmonella enterica subsp. enterica]
MLQHALRRLLAQQVTRTVVAEPDNFRLSAFRRIMLPAADFQQTVTVVPVFPMRVSGVVFAKASHAASRSRPWRISLHAPRKYITAVTAFSALYAYTRRLPPEIRHSVTRSRTSYRNR